MAGEQRAEMTAGQRAMGLALQTQAKFAALPPTRRLWMTVSAGLILSVALAMAWYVQRPDWQMLFSGLDGRDAQQVAQELGAASIPFQISADGSGVMVPAESMDKARMEVAAKGMPQSGRLGFELFDKPNWVGSEFDERVNYQRALEGELEHTIGTLGAVRSARVHLVLPQASLFTNEQKVAKASVVLKLKHTTLGPEQTESIRNLVAGAVENLSPEQVTLVDADGRANLEMKGGMALAGEDQHELEAKLIGMLEPLAGVGNVRATVHVSVDQSSEERTDEVYDPAQTAVLTQQKSEQSNAGTRPAQGVPGTASNTPAAAPVGAVQGSAKAAATGTPPLLQGAAQKDALPVFPQSGSAQGQTLKEESGTYAVTRHVTHSEAAPGRVRRISAAVVVNDRLTGEAAAPGKALLWKPRTTEEMQRLEQLARAAVGYDEERGDTVVMENVSFSSNAPEVQATGTQKVMEQAKEVLGAQPALTRTAVTGLLGAMLVLFVLKPVAGQLVQTLRDPATSLEGRGATVPGGLSAGGGKGAIGTGSAESFPSGIGRDSGEPTPTKEERGAMIFEEVTGHIRREPAHSTRLIEAWIASDGDE